MPPEIRQLVIIAGPTASGKSRLAVDLALLFRGEIINADSVQVYEGFDIGTGKLSEGERRGVPHHLLSSVDPERQFDSAAFVRETLKATASISAAGRLPFIVGGTGLYLKALLQGLFPGPGREPSIRARLEKEAAAAGPEALHDQLLAVDPVYAAKTGRRDLVRIIRALEVYELTGLPISRHFEATRSPLQGHKTVKIGIEIPRAELYRRIEDRVDAMFRAGLVEEVKSLLAKGVSPQAPAFKSLGYRQVLTYLVGGISLEKAVEATKTETRQYAKRQLTWFRKMEGLVWFDGRDLAGIEDFLRHNLI